MARILVADDDVDIRELVEFKLSTLGHDVVAVSDGAAAIDACQAERPDLAVLDVMMPGVSGLDAIRAIRADPALADLPVILLTARAQESDVETGFDSGADDYITKPFNIPELLARIKSHLRRANQQPVRNPLKEVGRNDPCPCGSQKKFKKCHGA